MSVIADLQALAMQRMAPRTARYGDAFYFAGTELPEPEAFTVPTRHGDVACELYRGRPDAGVYLHAHGGAFVMRFPRMDDFFARYLVATLGISVVSVDYAVAPQRRYPVAQEQVHDVGAWLAAHGSTLGLSDPRIGIGGFSAGGNLAASACLQARDHGSWDPACQLLAVPSLDVAEDPSAKKAVRPNPMIGPELLRLVRATYFKNVARRTEPYASPLRSISLAGLPPALVITAEYDTLRAEGDAYAARLRSAGIPVEHTVVPGVDHYFLERGPRGAKETMDQMARFLDSALGTAP